MKKYIKDNKIITEGTSIIDNNKIYYNPSDQIYKKFGWKEYIEETLSKSLEQVKQDKIDAIINYDISDNVNSFIINGELVWISKADRVGLMNSTNIEKAKGKIITYLWLNHTQLTISCDDLINMLSDLEEYALKCYNITEQHKATVLNLDSIEDVNNFDITSDYPIQLVFNI